MVEGEGGHGMTIPIRLDPVTDAAPLTPAVQHDDPMLRLQYYRETGQDDEAKSYEQYLRETGQYREPTHPLSAAPAGPSVRADASAALPRNRQGATGDFQAATANPGQQLKFGANVALSHALNAAQAVPGAEAAEAGAGSLITGKPYRESLSGLRGRIQRDVGPMATPEKLATGLALGRFLPFQNPATAGAVLGGADEALSADPDESLKMRAGKTVLGAGAGYAGGKLIDKAITTGKALLPSRLGGVGGTADDLWHQAAAERAKSASQLYAAATNEGELHGATQAVQDFIKDPEIAQRIAALKDLDQFKNVPEDSPQMMDALYKSLSDEETTLRKGLQVNDPSKPNTGRFKLKSVSNAKDRLLNALSTKGTKPPITFDVPAETHVVEPQITPGRETMAGPIGEGPLAQNTRVDPDMGDLLRAQPDPRYGANPTMQGPGGPNFMLRGKPDVVKPGVEINTPAMRVQTAPAEPEANAMMPSYRDAVKDFQKRSANMKALAQGAGLSQALRKQVTQTPTPGQIVSKAPKTIGGLRDWVRQATPDEIAAMRQGILGDTRATFALKGKTFAPFRQATGTAAKALRELPTDAQDLTTMLQNTGLSTGNVATPGAYHWILQQLGLSPSSK